ncbi:MAG: isocitrate/isopropylmalate dehydrogenase family protein [Rhodobacteraceae bacterium]|nr:isocitrate/isopropylmalate dehydrogenase family protein [Paracoccaceae bacterium]
MSVELTLLPGDGIGPEITSATRSVLEASDRLFQLDLSLREEVIGLAALEASGSTLPEKAFAAAREADGVVLGPVSHNVYPAASEGGINPSGALRKELDLYANIRPCKTRQGVPSRIGKAFDLVIFRENTEGFYADRCMEAGPGEILVTHDVAVAMRRITRPACLRIARRAFETASLRCGKVTAVHKANVLKVSDGLFLECCRQVAAEMPTIDYEELIIDAMCAHLVRRPDAFDVVVTTNMFGDILSDLASELSGSLGIGASLNASDARAMAQAQHGSAPDIAGRGIANPSSLIGSAGMLLAWIGERRMAANFIEAGRAVATALDAALADPATRCADLGGNCGTEAFARAVVAHLLELRAAGTASGVNT